MKTFIALLVLIISSVFAAPFDKRQEPDACGGFRITSPNQSGLQWTNGECYQVSFDAGNNAAGALKITSIDLVDSNGNVVKPQWTGSVDATQGYVPNFNLNIPKTGTYNFRVNAQPTAGAKCTRDTVTFTGTYNPNSGSAQC
ncbi:5759_t:CDS:2 [Ambispora gerdemannii]|uniref:5759_t:CDS:1 n=1 Tax=Ambispora gerdemannii TaxID=144530 RepID=A0A9N9FS06_9GLOM|nr:5759_t:CDS:2 [Ambispora gerdemannii]